MSSPFHIFSWQQPFLPALKQATDLWSGGRPGDAVIIVPHNRPWRYLVDIYAAAGATGLLPKVLSLPDMVRLWRMHASPVPLRTACLLDTFSCIFQGIIPYGAQMLVAISAAAEMGFALSAFSIMRYLFYPYLLLVSSLIAIFLVKGKKN